MVIIGWLAVVFVCELLNVPSRHCPCLKNTTDTLNLNAIALPAETQLMHQI
jgi:hypothetical protein